MMSYFNRLKKKFKKDFNIDIEPKVLDDDSLKIRIDSLMPHVAKKMGIKYDKLSLFVNNIGLNKDLTINASLAPTNKRETFQISINRGLILFIYKMLLLLISRMEVVDNDNKIIEKTSISDEEMIRVAKRLMTAFWTDLNSKDTFIKTIGIELFKLTKAQIELSASIQHYAECFAIAHEFGHAIIEKCPGKVQLEFYTVSAALESRINPFFEIYKFKEREKNEVLNKWTIELTADLIGLKLCLELVDDDIIKIVVFASAEFTFLMMYMLDIFREKKTGKRYFYGTISHPPLELRLEFLHSYADRLELLQLGKSFRQLSEYIISKV